MALNPIIKKKWLNALRSGKWKQTIGCLEDSNGNCCLGVLCHITGNGDKIEENRGFPVINDEDEESEAFMGLSREVQQKLASLNDEGEDGVYNERPFAAPIRYISRNL